MRILYMSCHEILEYDEVKLFSEMGHEVFSLGAYTHPGGDSSRKRPALDNLPYDPHFIELSLQYDRRYLHPEQLEGFDMVIVMHSPEFITMKDNITGEEKGNWPLFRQFINNGGRVVWRSIGQSIPRVEQTLAPMRAEGLEVVRYSPAEETIQDNIGSDAMIRFYKDPDDWKDWNGSQRHVINFTQSLKDRARFTGFDMMYSVFHGLPAKVFGPGNDDLGILSGGLLSYDEQRQAMRDSRVFFYHGTYPASYTLSLIEVMMTGTPIVAVGPQHGNSQEMFPHQSTYEVDTIIENGISGFVSDNTRELHDYVQLLLNDENKAKAVSAFGRQRAIDLFGRAKIKSEWETFFEGGRK